MGFGVELNPFGLAAAIGQALETSQAKRNAAIQVELKFSMV